MVNEKADWMPLSQCAVVFTRENQKTRVSVARDENENRNVDAGNNGEVGRMIAGVIPKNRLRMFKCSISYIHYSIRICCNI